MVLQYIRFSVAIVGGGVHQYGENITLLCGVFGSGSNNNFTWSAPEGSTSLERGSISSDMHVSTLIFEAREEDSGVFTCEIDTGAPAITFVIVGNASQC